MADPMIEAVDLMRERLVLPCQRLTETPLRNRIDQEGEGHYHEQSLHTRGFLNKQGRHKKQGVFETAEPTLCLGLRFVPGDDLGIAELLRRHIAPQHKTRMILLGLLEAFGIGAHMRLTLPLRGFDRSFGGRPPLGGIAFMLDP